MTESDATFAVTDIWDALETSPQEAANLRLRAKLMVAISDAVGARRSTRTKVAATLGLSVANLARLIEGDIDAFSVDDLVVMAERVGLTIDMTVAPRAA